MVGRPARGDAREGLIRSPAPKRGGKRDPLASVYEIPEDAPQIMPAEHAEDDAATRFLEDVVLLDIETRQDKQGPIEIGAVRGEQDCRAHAVADDRIRAGTS